MVIRETVKSLLKSNYKDDNNEAEYNEIMKNARNNMEISSEVSFEDILENILKDNKIIIPDEKRLIAFGTFLKNYIIQNYPLDMDIMLTYAQIVSFEFTASLISSIADSIDMEFKCTLLNNPIYIVFAYIFIRKSFNKMKENKDLQIYEAKILVAEEINIYKF